MDTRILLENGTNELEVLEFLIGDCHYGINVAKVREILVYDAVTKVPNAHPYIEGIFMPRDTMLTVIDLQKALGMGESPKEGMLIITNFNKLNIAFHVSKVAGIHRVSWEDIVKPDSTISTEDYGVATGIIKIKEKLTIILDFEKIVTDICPETGLKVSDMNQLGDREKNDTPILIAEDSKLLSKLISESLLKAGYTNLIMAYNGKEAWDLINKYKAEGTVLEKIKCVITDIEMPQMDGHRLTKLIKSDDMLKQLPVIIFSSLVNEEMRKKGEMLGADRQLSKPEIGNLVSTLDEVIIKYNRGGQ